MAIHVGLSLMPDDGWRAAVLPLFDAGAVDALEWSFDQCWGSQGTPGWAAMLLDHYAAAGRLWGHGVSFSGGSVDAADRHARWLEGLAHEVTLRPLRGVSEHLGFMIAGAHDIGAPLPLPDGPGARAVLRRRLQALADTAGVPVGLENLALALDADEPWQQGPLLADVLAATDGYLVLDLHNLWCQIANYDLDGAALLASYPLARARVIHIAGGSWWSPPGSDARFRRDTHDGAVPDEVFALLAAAVPRCPALEVVVLERLGDSLRTDDDAVRLREDFAAVRATVAIAEVGHG